jgi:hypothetical protein
MPDDEETVDRILHIEDMKEELRELAGGEAVIHHVDEDLSLEMEEQFLEHMLAFERAEQVTHRELLARDGVTLPPPDRLSDEQLAAVLAEVARGLAAHRAFLESTDHLSDRELYCRLWEEVLDETTPLLPPDDPTNCHIDLVSSGSEEDIALWLTYYADEEDRIRWAQEFPDEVIPPHRDLPYDRDRHLPKPPPPPNRYDDPEVLAAWFAECRERLLKSLATEGLAHGDISEEPHSYASGFASIWEVPHPYLPNTAGWWAINGDLPTNYLPVSEARDPRAFLRAIAPVWRATAYVLERGDQPPEFAPVPPEDRAHVAALLHRRADILDEWAADEEAWEEE